MRVLTIFTVDGSVQPVAVTVGDEVPAPTAGPGQVVVEGDYADGTWKWDDAPVKKSQAEMDAFLMPPPPTYTPRPVLVVSRFQARAALHMAGLLPAVEELMADPETDMLSKLAWTDATEFRRNSPTLQTTAVALGLTEAQLDGLFANAATIVA
jgi:hypothetical protein